MTIQRSLMINIVDELISNRVLCESCKRDIGVYNEEKTAVLLIAYRECRLEHVSTFIEHHESGPTETIVNSLSEIEDYIVNSYVPVNLECENPDISLMHVSSIDISHITIDSKESDVEEKRENEAEIDLFCNETMPFENEIKRRKTSTPKRNHIDEAIENVVAGRDFIVRPTRPRIEFVEFNRSPLQNVSNFIDFSDLAVLLPNEKMPKFNY